MLFDLFELVNNNTTVLADILLMQSYIVLSLYMYILLYNIIYAILILEWVLDFSPTQTNITMTMISYLIIIILKCHTFEITIIMEVMYLNLESHRLFRIIQLFFKITLFKQILIALYILHVAHGYMKTNLYICGVSSYSTIPYCNQVLRLVTRFLYTAQFVHVQVVGYEPADLTVHPPPKRSRVGSFFSHRCLVPPKFFPQRKSGFCRRYSH